MKACIMTLALLGFVVGAKAGPDFLPGLSAEERAAAGLDKLTPAEQAQLEILVQRFKSGEVAEARQEADQRILAAETEARAAVTKANEAAAKAKAEAETKAAASPAKNEPGWFAALLTLDRAGSKPEKEEPLKSRLVGDFDGWYGRTVFQLENGTRWKQQNPTESFIYSPTLHSPQVEISPASFGGFWLKVKEAGMKVRVVPLELIKRS